MIKENKISKIFNGRGFWWLAILIFLSLLYSTSWHYVHGPNRSTNNLYWHRTDDIIREIAPDSGICSDRDISIDGDEGWKLSNTSGDAAAYMYQAETGGYLEPPYNSPYRYRMLTSWLARGIHWLTGLSYPYSFALLNSLASLLTALIFVAYLIRFHKLSRLLALIGGILYITSASVTRSAALPMVESLSHLWMILIFWTVQTKSWYLFLVYSVAGVFTKEVLAIGSLFYPAVNLKKSEGVKEKLVTLSVSIVPILAFIAVRLLAGGRIDEVNYGYNILQNEIPQMFRRLLYWEGLFETLLGIFLTFGFLWLGLLNLGKSRFLRIAFLTVCVPITLATILLSPHIIRPLGVVFPVVIPLFLLFFSKVRVIDQERIE
jgi:hypothetical protein